MSCPRSIGGQPLEVLQPVPLGAHLHGVASHRVQVDEQSRVDLLAERDLASAVVGRQPLERGSFGVVVVVHVHAGVSRAPLGEELDELGGGGGLLVAVVGPPRLVDPLAVGLAQDQPEQEEQVDVGPPERIALEVEEHVAVVGLGELFEAATPHRIVGRVDHPERRRLAVGLRPGQHLERGLLDQPLEAFASDPVERLVALGQREEGGDAVVLECVALGLCGCGPRR